MLIIDSFGLIFFFILYIVFQGQEEVQVLRIAGRPIFQVHMFFYYY